MIIMYTYTCMTNPNMHTYTHVVVGITHLKCSFSETFESFLNRYYKSSILPESSKYMYKIV